MANGFPSYIQRPPMPSGDVREYLALQQKLLQPGGPGFDGEAAYKRLSELRDKIAQDPKAGFQLRANQAHDLATSINDALQSGQMFGQTLSADQRAAMQGTLGLLQKGQLPTKGAALDIQSGKPVVPNYGPAAKAVIEKINR
ncbi:MAG: hypothetical protein U1E65_17340 [Myxococcota bacterium]